MALSDAIAAYNGMSTDQWLRDNFVDELFTNAPVAGADGYKGAVEFLASGQSSDPSYQRIGFLDF
jgi:hypothetical protein